MKISTSIAVVFACASIAACGGAGNEANTENADANMILTDNLGTTDMNMDMNATDMNMDMNSDLNADVNADLNADVNATTNTL